jgi:uncharacterized membrane protein YfcA
MTAAVSFVQAGIGFGSLLLAAPLLVLVGEFELLLGVTLIPGTVAGYVLSSPFVRWLDAGYTRASVLGVSIGAGLLLILRRSARRPTRYRDRARSDRASASWPTAIRA